VRAVISPVGLSLNKKPSSGEVLGYYREQRAALEQILKSPDSDEIYFVPPAHKMTIKISKLVSDYFYKKGYQTHILPIKVFSGKSRDFSPALINYVDVVSNIIETHSGDAVMNATNSFKVIAAYNHLMASLYKIDIYYLDDTYGKKESVLRLPAFPLTYDIHLWKEKEAVLEAIIKNNKTGLIKKLPDGLKALFPRGKTSPVALSFYRAYRYNKTSELRIIMGKNKIINEIQDYSQVKTLVLRKDRKINNKKLSNIMSEIKELIAFPADYVREDEKWRRKQFSSLCKDLTDEILHPAIIKRLEETNGGNLILYMNQPVLRFPVEKFIIKGKQLNEIFTIGRSIVPPRNFEIRSETSAENNHGKALIIRCDPVSDLKHSVSEMNCLKNYFKNKNITTKILSGRELNKEVVARELLKADIVHFIGHTVCNHNNHLKSGWVINESGFKKAEGRFSMKDVKKLATLPKFIFANSCSSGSAAFLGGLFILNGIKNYAAALYSVPDKFAIKFSQKFYDGILQGKPVGDAMSESRGRLYVLYGDPRNKLV